MQDTKISVEKDKSASARENQDDCLQESSLLAFYPGHNENNMGKSSFEENLIYFEKKQNKTLLWCYGQLRVFSHTMKVIHVFTRSE